MENILYIYTNYTTVLNTGVYMGVYIYIMVNLDFDHSAGFSTWFIIIFPTKVLLSLQELLGDQPGIYPILGLPFILQALLMVLVLTVPWIWNTLKTKPWFTIHFGPTPCFSGVQYDRG